MCMCWAIMSAVLFREKPSAAVVFSEFWDKKVCHHCFKVDASKKCGGCGQAKYCSEACQKPDWKLHRLECIVIQKFKGNEEVLEDIKNHPEIRLLQRLMLRSYHDLIKKDEMVEGWPKELELRDISNSLPREDLYKLGVGRRGRMDREKEDAARRNPYTRTKDQLMMWAMKSYQRNDAAMEEQWKKYEEWFGGLQAPILKNKGAFKEWLVVFSEFSIPIILANRDGTWRNLGLGFYVQLTRFNQTCSQTDADVEVACDPDVPSIQIVRSGATARVENKLTESVLGPPTKNIGLVRYHMEDSLPGNDTTPLKGCIGSKGDGCTLCATY